MLGRRYAVFFAVQMQRLKARDAGADIVLNVYRIGDGTVMFNVVSCFLRFCGADDYVSGLVAGRDPQKS
jgi:hypothetical protein